MLGIEWENFEKLDKQEYIVKRNPKFLSQYRAMKKKNFYTILSLNEIQDFIDSITRFYEFKYPSKMLDKVEWVSPDNDSNLDSCIKLSKLLDIKQLQYRLNHNQLCFLECSYGGTITLSAKADSIHGIPLDYYVRIDSLGKIDEYDLIHLKNHKLLEDMDKIESIEDLYEICRSHPKIINYQNLERHIYNHRENINLRNETLNLVMLSLLYANGELPFKGYVRAKSFVRMFNKEYHTDLNMDRLDDIMSIDYKNTKEVKRLLRSRK